MIFEEKYFYRFLSAINSNVDSIVNSIDSRYNMDNKTFMQSLAINIFISVYRQVTAILILLSIMALESHHYVINSIPAQALAASFLILHLFHYSLFSGLGCNFFTVRVFLVGMLGLVITGMQPFKMTWQDKTVLPY